MATIIKVWNPDQWSAEIDKILHTDYAHGIDLHFSVSMDEIPTLKYTIERFIVPDEEPWPEHPHGQEAL